MKQSLLPEDFDLTDATPLWEATSDRKAIEREFIFKDFEQAFRFMTQCAQYAEQIDHHPDWSNSWNRVMVRLSTHSVGGLTQLDLQMAQAMDTFANQITAN